MDKNYSIQDLVDIERLRELFENFSKATGFTTGFVSYPDQKLLIATGWRDICAKFHRACPASTECCKESNVYLTACLKDLRELSIKPCGNGLVDGATPVIIRGRHLASLATGQVLMAPPDIAFFKGLAAKYGYDTDAYLAALAKVPVVSEEQLKNALTFLAGLAVQIAEEGLHRLQIQKKTADLSKAKEEVDRKVERRTVALKKANEQLQVELAERKRMEEALEKEEAQYSAIVEAFDGIIYICSKDYRVEFINQRGIQRCGRNPVGEFCYKALHDLEAVCPWCVNDRVFAGETARWEVQSPKDNRWYYVVNTPIRHSDGTISKQAMILDITERKRAEDMLKESAERLNVVISNAGAGLCLLDPSGHVVQTNSEWLRVAEFTETETVGRHIWDIFPQSPQELRQMHDRVRAGETIVVPIHRQLLGSREVWYEGRLSPIRMIGGTGVLITAIDVTERKRAEEELLKVQAQLKGHAENLEQTVAEGTAKLWEQTAERDKLQEELLKISEREKQLIAQEMHDGLCQHFAGTAMMTSLLHRSLAARQAPEADQAKEICELLNTGVLEARNLSHGLHPVKDKGEGLMEALSGLAQKVTKLFHIQCTFCCDEAVLINSQATATHLFRIAQEAMNNALKHGQASRVTITLKNENEGVCLSIRDNGIGIPRELPATRGMGMQIMNHRADVIGAVLTVCRAGKRGTVVTCLLPARL